MNIDSQKKKLSGKKIKIKVDKKSDERISEMPDDGNKTKVERKLVDNRLKNLREEISTLPLGELLSLKDHMPAKLYKEAVFAKCTSDSSDDDATADEADLVTQSGHSEQSVISISEADNSAKKEKVFKRDNRKRPREMSAKKPVSVIRDVFATKKPIFRDPRFDNAVGSFDASVFNRQYSFLNDMKKEEYQALRKEIKEEKDPNRLQQLRFLKQRMENQRRSEEEKERKKTLKREVRMVNMERLKEGKDPFYVKNSELKRRLIDDHFERLEKEGKLKKYQERRENKLSKKDKRPVA